MENKENYVVDCGGIHPERPELTELVFILDRSGSMSGLEQDTIGGFNAMIEKQKKEEGLAFVSTVLFSNASKVLHDRVEVQEVAPLTEKDYVLDCLPFLLLFLYHQNGCRVKSKLQHKIYPMINNVLLH